MRASGFTMLELLVSVSIIAILGAICVPTYSRLVGSAKQAEAKTNLRALYDLEVAYFMSAETFTSSVAKIGFNPGRSNRYQYNLNGTSSANADSRSGGTASTSVTADAIMIDTFKYPAAYTTTRLAAMKCGTVAAVVPGKRGSFVAVAQANLDEDLQNDQWSIASMGRDLHACADVAENVPAGNAANELDDTIEGQRDHGHGDDDDHHDRRDR